MTLRLAAACAVALLAAACQTPAAPGPVLSAPLAADPPTLRTALPALRRLEPRQRDSITHVMLAAVTQPTKAHR